jgi:hypothetical protein
MFFTVQDLLAAKRKWGERPQRRTHYLKGSLACGLCKRQLSIGYSTGHGGVYPYFFCLGRHRDKSCRLPYLSFERIETMVEDYWEQGVIEPAEIEAIRHDVTEHLQDVTRNHEGERKHQNQRLYVVPDGIAGADLATPFAHLLTDDLEERLAVEAQVAAGEPLEAFIRSGFDRNELFPGPRAHRIERPRGLLPAETENRALDLAPGSNETVLVGLPGFEPGTSCPPDKRANQAAPQPVNRRV